ncbi:LytR/AlgR family response regulator transcription factor [Thalassotalea marina]|uniref:DNA-binding response regulator n=1 Tax=Thalassotalea marina TaxID=1673741 RepID=A0A919BES5_9GAMM|nr:LytTR family DNA-binding domain-containing protein [Thalassotalea marina]GHF83894.1 DNA-binding response regulator [Thalassotalea marina]
MLNKNQSTYSLIFAEDEKPAQEKLSHQLSMLDNIEVLGFATTGKEAVSLINQLQPDIVLLDIQMPEIDGLDVVDLLDYQPLIIFTTAYDQYAIQAFEKSSIDYLLKPFPLGRLKSAIEKATAQLATQRDACAYQNKEQQVFNLQSGQQKKLVSKNGDRIFLLKPEHLKFIKSEQGNTLAWDGERFSHINDSLDQLEQSLAAQQFVRVHRGYLVNLDHVSEIQRWFNGKLMLIIDDDKKTEISTSRAGAEKLKSLIGF